MHPEFVLNHVYFTALADGAGLSTELAPGTGTPRVYVAEPEDERGEIIN